MALEPIVKFYDVTQNVELTNLTTDPTNPNPVKWSVGTVKAGNESSTLSLRIWNNKGGSQLCSTMQECKLLTLDSVGGQNEALVTGGWLQGKCTSLNDASYKAMIASTPGELSIGALGTTDFSISGATNDGSVGATPNYSNVSLKLVIPDGAVHGIKNFSVAIKYFFV